MRTPGADRELALGFLFSEGLVRSRADVARVDVDEPAGVVNVVFDRGRADAVAEALGQRRQVAMNSSCGLCGRRSLESLEINAPPFAREWSVRPRSSTACRRRCRRLSPPLRRPAACTRPGCSISTGQLVASAEDVGRHNAVDKLVGRMFEAGRLPLSRLLLLVSGRSSFEIVQKAWLARHPAGGRGLGAVEPGGRPGPSRGHDAAGVCAGRAIQHLRPSRTRGAAGA